jgi:hypothetical protein
LPRARAVRGCGEGGFRGREVGVADPGSFGRELAGSSRLRSQLFV